MNNYQEIKNAVRSQSLRKSGLCRRGDLYKMQEVAYECRNPFVNQVFVVQNLAHWMKRRGIRRNPFVNQVFVVRATATRETYVSRSGLTVAIPS